MGTRAGPVLQWQGMWRWLATVLLGVLLLAGQGAAAAKKRAGATGKKGTVAVAASTPGARVLIDGKDVGRVPIKGHAVGPGTHTVLVKRIGYLDYTEKIQVTAGRAVSVQADLMPVAGIIKVTANVPKAAVAVDGRPVGKAPGEFEVKLGARVITVGAPGYATYTRKIVANPGVEVVIQQVC